MLTRDKDVRITTLFAYDTLYCAGNICQVIEASLVNLSARRLKYILFEIMVF